MRRNKKNAYKVNKTVEVKAIEQTKIILSCSFRSLTLLLYQLSALNSLTLQLPALVALSLSCSQFLGNYCLDQKFTIRVYTCYN